MSKLISFFDWENSFRKKTHPISKISHNKKAKTTLGIPLKEYHEFLEKWREKNLQLNRSVNSCDIKYYD